MTSWPNLHFPPINLYTAPYQPTYHQRMYNRSRAKLKPYVVEGLWEEDDPFGKAVQQAAMTGSTVELTLYYNERKRNG